MALNNDDIKQLIAILQKGLETEDDQPIAKPKRKRAKAVKKHTKTFDNNEKVKEILGIDLKSLHREDIDIDKKLSGSRNNNYKSKRTPIKLVDVTCRICGKREQISPTLLFDSPSRYKCNSCCSSPG
jgi:hypothetical protein